MCFLIITVRNEVEKVMFLRVSVCPRWVSRPTPREGEVEGDLAWVCLGRHPPADGTHPTGMHFRLIEVLQNVIDFRSAINSNIIQSPLIAPKVKIFNY